MGLGFKWSVWWVSHMLLVILKLQYDIFYPLGDRLLTIMVYLSDVEVSSYVKYLYSYLSGFV